MMMMDKQYAYHTFSVNLLNSENNYVAKIFSEVKINKNCYALMVTVFLLYTFESFSQLRRQTKTVNNVYVFVIVSC